jgi:hypothetical protein
MPLTKEYTTALIYSGVFEQVIEIQCALAQTTNYNLPLIDEKLIKLSNTPETRFLLQSEIRAI